MPPSPAKLALLRAALSLFRRKGYNHTTVDDLCTAATVSKGSFFHHFASKQDLALAAIQFWNETTGHLFAQAPYHSPPAPLAKLLAYLDFRESLLTGQPAEFSCLLGAIVQETFDSHPALRDACRAGIDAHARTLAPYIAAARQRSSNAEPNDDDEQLALHLQAVLQGAFILAKSRNSPAPVHAAIHHLRQYLQLLFSQHTPEIASHAR